jgi:hypothetical protein
MAVVLDLLLLLTQRVLAPWRRPSMEAIT